MIYILLLTLTVYNSTTFPSRP